MSLRHPAALAQAAKGKSVPAFGSTTGRAFIWIALIFAGAAFSKPHASGKLGAKCSKRHDEAAIQSCGARPYRSPSLTLRAQSPHLAKEPTLISFAYAWLPTTESRSRPEQYGE
jgi:hypothetical protein